MEDMSIKIERRPRFQNQRSQEEEESRELREGKTETEIFCVSSKILSLCTYKTFEIQIEREEIKGLYIWFDPDTQSG